MALARQQRMQIMVEGTALGRQCRQWNVHGHGPGLADAQCTAVALILDCRVPPSAQMNHVIGPSQGQSDAPSARDGEIDEQAAGRSDRPPELSQSSKN